MCVYLQSESKTKESPKVSDPIGQEQNSGPKNFALGMPKTTKK